ncbi:E3 ubiquitin-protein ligase UPL5-like isoform X1 [Aristolochia californica]|uniref:E3 ubiquitin-protein ligase UPL5-like isoform X1 n=1 Tax=Aristolochia californica TaxID=171875 RepID=UPI0035E1027C
MSHGEFATLSSTAAIDWRLDRIPSKRKFEDYAPGEDDDDSHLVPVRMRKDSPDSVAAVSSQGYSDTSAQSCKNSASGPTSSSNSIPDLHFFVRMISGGNTVVVHANSDDSIESVHEQIRQMTGIPIIEQRLIYRGKQLSWDQTLAECGVQNDAGLQLVGRMRSTEHPRAWQLVNDTVSAICRLCRGPDVSPSRSVKSRVNEFLRMAPHTELDMTWGHLQVFNLAGAPSALVMLFLSPNKGNRECAEDSIRLFLSPNIDLLPEVLQNHCAYIVLEFCKLLRRAAPGCPLYLTSRSTLGSLLETIGIAHGSRYFDYAKASEIIGELYPFVTELAFMILTGLDAQISCSSFPAIGAADVNEFTAFVRPLRHAMEDHLREKTPIAVRPSRGNGPPQDEVVSFHTLFSQLLMKVGKCLEKVDEYLAVNGLAGSENYRFSWSQYLVILKELNSISKMFQGEEGRFRSVLRLRKNCINFLIKQTRRRDDHLWLLRYKDVTDFESRRHLVMMMFPDVRDDFDELHEMLIDRNQILEESFEYIGRAERESLHSGLFMEFKNEEATGPGVLREWFCLVCQAIFNLQNPLFLSCPNDRRRFFPNPVVSASGVDPLHLDYFVFCGRLIGLALLHKIQVGVAFDRAFFLQLGGKCIFLEDIQDADPCLYKSCRKLLELDADLVDSDALGLTFVREIEEVGSLKVVELCPGGKSISVDSRNRKEYVDLLIQHRFATSVSEQITRFSQGFGDILSNSSSLKLFFASLDLKDLDQMLYGSDDAFNIRDWKEYTEYNGYQQNDLHICWFWQIVEAMSLQQQRILLHFWSSIKYLPVEGFSGLGSKLFIFRAGDSADRLPTSHTCFYRLCLPPYPSLAVMQDRISIIIQEHVSQSFGMW